MCGCGRDTECSPYEGGKLLGTGVRRSIAETGGDSE